VAAAKPVIASRQALLDIDDAVAHYLLEAGVDVAQRFVDAVETAFDLIARQPGIGSPRYAHELQIPDLRSWGLRAFPHVLVYLVRDDAVDVIRVLHGARDIPATLADPEPA
jgi:toxin ParE1/3/4